MIGNGGFIFHKTTYPMMRAPAVLIQRPSPNGFGGTDDRSKRMSDEGGLNAAERASDTTLDDFLVVVLMAARRFGRL
jgi:hypothetical protein